MKSFREVKGVVFDMDGTLVLSDLDFARIRAEAEVPDGIPILEFLEAADPSSRRKAERVLMEHEKRAAVECTLQPGAEQVLEALRKRGLKLALLTRNSRESVDQVVARFAMDFDVSIAREDARPKPSPEPVLKIAAALGLSPAELLVVGDYIFDVQAGRAAGSHTALLRTDKNGAFESEAEIVVDQLIELLDYLPARATTRAQQEAS